MTTETLIVNPTPLRKAVAIATLFLAGVGFGTLAAKVAQLLF